MSGNPKESKWYSTSKTSRRRRPLNVTLSPEALARLDELASERKQLRSAVIESLILEAPKRR